MKKLLTLSLTALAVISASASVNAQSEKDKKEKELQTIVISTTQSEQVDSVTPVSVEVITSSDIQESGANSIADILRAKASVQIKDSSGGSRSSISMRGFADNNVNNVLIVVDGRKLNNPSLEAPLLSSISIKDIERIEIIQGSGGVLFGDQAVGGVINIITKRPSDKRVSITALKGSYDLSAYTITASESFDNGIGYRVSAETKESDNYRDNNELKYENVFSEIRYDGGWGNIFYENSYIDDQLNTPGFLSNEQIEDDPKQVGFAGLFNHKIKIERLGSKVFLNDNLTIDSDYSVRDSDGVSSNAFSTNIQDTEVKFFNTKLLGDWITSRGKILLTTGYENTQSEYVNTGFATADWQNKQVSAYSQLVLPIVQGLSASVGHRRTDVKDNDLLNSKRKEDSATASEVGLNYLIGNHRLFQRWAKAFRFANADENGKTLADVQFLSPQKSISIEAGYEYRASKNQLSVMLYDLDIDDEIYYDSVLAANINLESSVRSGLIIDASHDFSESLSLGAGISLNNAEYTSGSYKGNDVPDVADKTGTFNIVYRLDKTSTLYFDALFVGNRRYSADNANTFDELGGYTLTNFNYSWVSGPWDLNVRVNNLGNKKYSTLLYSSGGYPAAERNAQVSISYDLL